MGKISWFIIGAVFFTACGSAAVKFNYKFYNLAGNSYSGTLLGPTDKDYLPFTECKPVNNKQKCAVVFYTELAAIISDYKQTKQELIDLQRRCVPK